LIHTLDYGWQTRPSGKTCNPVYARPSNLSVFREDHTFLLDTLIPRPGQMFGTYDLILASQPWRGRNFTEFKASKVLAPLTRSLAPGGRLIAIQSAGNDPALEIVQKVWPGENPFQVDRFALPSALRTELGRDARRYSLAALPDDKAIFREDVLK